LMIVKKPGFSNLVVKCPCRGTTYAISPVMANLDGMRIVLNWGQLPADLDSHLVYPQNHIYFTQQRGKDANLDVDDTTSFGPETITIEKKNDGRYVYAVHDYSDRENQNTSNLANSGAKVFVYIGQTLIRTYDVPKSQKGNLWAVFAVTEAGEFEDFNVLKGVVSEDRLDLAEFQGVIEKTAPANLSFSAASQTSAKELNRQGEVAYHAKSYDEAIRLYQAAIDQDGNYGQAYSNLGLVFQKAGRVSEALWANRKAIALASGPTAATVRASSHFNNGMIYEAASQWQNALQEYQLAKREKVNAVYDQAILRMQKKGAK
jgi:tetratricopeptide (TPR) repeat protein